MSIRSTHNPNTQEIKTQRIPGTIQILASANKWGDHQSIYTVENSHETLTQYIRERAINGDWRDISYIRATQANRSLQPFNTLKMYSSSGVSCSLLLFSAWVQYIHKYILYMYGTLYNIHNIYNMYIHITCITSKFSYLKRQQEKIKCRNCFPARLRIRHSQQ